MPDLGKKYTCYSCHTKFYDLGKPVPTCPKCGADQRDADEAPSVPASRSRARAAAAVVIVEEPADDDFGADGEVATPATGDEDEDIIPEADRGDEPAAADDEEDEEY
jgi:hypothetical protein